MCFEAISVYMNVCVSVFIWFSCAFYLAIILFLLFVCFVLHQFDFFILLLLFSRCLVFYNIEEKEYRFERY